MIHLSFSPPKDVAVAVSGGCDSMAVLDFLRRSRNVTALHFNHNTPGSDTYQTLVERYCAEHKIPLIVGALDDVPDEGVSLEDFWRRERYSFFEDTHGLLPVITCHHLDDVAETWLFTSLHGASRLIPSKRGIYLRPFLETRKAVFEDWCERKEVPYIEDPSNTDTRFMRNYIRHELLPKALRVNPGLHKVLRKKVKTAAAAQAYTEWEPEWVRSNYEMT